MVAQREPIDRVVDLLVAAPTCTLRAARRAAPLLADVVRRGISVGAPDDHRVASDISASSAASPMVVADVVDPSGAPTIDSEALAIDDYDHLAARQVVDRLGGLTADELAIVDAYERSHRHRQTILRRIEQLRS